MIPTVFNYVIDRKVVEDKPMTVYVAISDETHGRSKTMEDYGSILYICMYIMNVLWYGYDVHMEMIHLRHMEQGTNLC